MNGPVACAACRAGIPMIWVVPSEEYMHEAPGLSVRSCAVLEARAQWAKDLASDRGNEDLRGR